MDITAATTWVAVMKENKAPAVEIGHGTDEIKLYSCMQAQLAILAKLPWSSAATSLDMIALRAGITKEVPTPCTAPTER